MNIEELTNDAIRYVTKILGDNSGGHDAAHSIRVYRNAIKIAEKEPGSDLLVVSLASLLHDVDDHKIFKNRNNENARSFLSDKCISDEITEKIISVINSVSFSKNRGMPAVSVALAI